MKKPILLFFCFAIFVSAGYTRVFLTITANIGTKTQSVIVIQGNDEFSKTFTSVLKQDLIYSDYFDVTKAATEENVNYEDILNGLSKDIQVFITGRVNEKIEIRVYDTADKNIVYQQEFTPVSDPAQMAHIISDAIVSHITDTNGIAQTKIAYLFDNPGKNEIHICDYDGENDQKIFSPDFLVNFPRWLSPNKIIYLSYRNDFPILETINLKNDKTGTFIADPGLNACPAVFRNNNEVAVVLSKSGNPEIYLTDSNGKIIKKITDISGIVSSPTVSPDGSKIVFVSDRDGRTKLWMIDISGIGLRELPIPGNYLTYPSWSPNGNYLAYISREAGGSKMVLNIYDLNTGVIKSLTDPISWVENPSWAPDSRHILFTRTENYKDSLWIIDIYTSTMRFLKNGKNACWLNY